VPPTEAAAESLRAENYPAERIAVTGNTVIDALQATVAREARSTELAKKYAFLGQRRVVLITGHWRENFGEPFRGICAALLQLARKFTDHEFLYPVHLNPNVREPVYSILGTQPNMHLVPPASYPEFVWLMNRCHLILTDSGGVQEEAPSLRKPVLILRENTERSEILKAGAGLLVGSARDKIVSVTSKLLTDPAHYQKMQIDESPYGDGRAADRIVEILRAQSWRQVTTKVAA